MEIKFTLTFVTVGIFLVLGYIAIIISVVTQPSSSSLRAGIELQYKRRIDTVQLALMEAETKLTTLLNEKTTETSSKKSSAISLSIKKSPERVASRPGVIILGMHRSGTSVLGGLVNKMGLKTGGPLIAPAEDNEKGFFERIDVVLQNDALLQSQHLHYALNTYKYDSLHGLQKMLEEKDNGEFFSEGRRGLKFLNDPTSIPWMLKDPRLCITFRSWLPLLTAMPAVLFTYRHPLDVGLSMNKRETEHFMIGKGIRMWYVYNKMAVKQSHDLCRIVSSHRKIMQQPRVELDRIFDELQACGVAAPHKLSESDINSFVDIKLQHGKSSLQDDPCQQDVNNLMLPSSWQTNDPNHIKLYREAMRVYCAFEDRTAFQSQFQWDESITDN